jgi:hypothetical protein
MHQQHWHCHLLARRERPWTFCVKWRKMCHARGEMSLHPSALYQIYSHICVDMLFLLGFVLGVSTAIFVC